MRRRRGTPTLWWVLALAPQRGLAMCRGIRAGPDAIPTSSSQCVQGTGSRYERRNRSSVVNTRLVSGDHVLNIYEGIFPTVNFKNLQSFVNELAKGHAFALAVVDG